MEVTIHIPDELGANLDDPSRIALEALAARAYESGFFSVEQVRGLLGFPSRWEAQDLLARFGVWPGLSAEEILQDAETALAFSGAVE